MNKETKKFITECLKQPNDKYNELGKVLAEDLAQRLHDYIIWKTKKEEAEKVIAFLSKQLTRLQKGIDKPHVVFKKLGENHYTVEFKV